MDRSVRLCFSRVQDSTLWWYRGGISSAWWVTSTAEWWRHNKAKPGSAVMASSHQRLGANMACLQASAVTHWKWLVTQHLTPGRVITPGCRGRPVLSRLHFLHLSLRLEKILRLSGDHAFLPNTPPKLIVAEFWKLTKFSWFHSLSGCALVWSSPRNYARTI